MIEMLRDRALIWFRNNNQHWEILGRFKRDFLKIFMHCRYFLGLANEIRRRVQVPKKMQAAEMPKDFKVCVWI